MTEYILLAAGACLFGFLLIAVRNSGAAKSLALNSLAGFASIGAVNLAAAATGVGLAVNVWTILTAAFLGLPGVTGLMFLRLLWQI